VETAKTLINDILQEIFVQAAEQPTQAPDFQTALRYTNRYMQQLNADGVNLGWTNLVQETDVPTIPDGAILGVIYNVAFQLANQYDIEVSPVLAKNAADSMRVMEKLGTTIVTTQYPNTLPIGSGNEQYSDNLNHFYEEEQR